MEWKQGYEEFCPSKTCEQCLCAQMDKYDHYKISFVTWVKNLHIDTFCLNLFFL